MPHYIFVACNFKILLLMERLEEITIVFEHPGKRSEATQNSDFLFKAHYSVPDIVLGSHVFHLIKKRESGQSLERMATYFDKIVCAIGQPIHDLSIATFTLKTPFLYLVSRVLTCLSLLILDGGI